MIHAIFLFEWFMPQFHIINIASINSCEEMPNGQPTGRVAPSFVVVILGIGIQIMYIKDYGNQ